MIFVMKRWGHLVTRSPSWGIQYLTESTGKPGPVSLKNNCLQNGAWFSLITLGAYTVVFLVRSGQMCARLCPTLYDPMDCSLPGSSVHGIFQARILEWVAISSSRGSSRPRDWTHISCVFCIGRWVLYHWVTWEDQDHVNSICSKILSWMFYVATIAFS